MKNRDYFTKPGQIGSRSSSDYGRTRLTEDRPRRGKWWYIGCGLVALYFVAQVLR